VYEKYAGDIILDGAKTYTVKKGDYLARIARNQYGSRNGYYFPLIMLASRNQVKDPDFILAGDTLTIPDLQRNLSDPGARQKIKEFLTEIAEVYNKRLGKRWGTRSRNELRALAASL
jgi:LysM repeat protein